MSIRKRTLLQPESAEAMHSMKTEIMHELGIFSKYSELANEFATELTSATPDYIEQAKSTPFFDWAKVSSREAGAVGGQMTARLIAQAQQSFLD